MLKPNPPGRPPELTTELKDKLIDAAARVLVPNQIAAKCKVHKSTLYDWLNRGEVDSNSGINSIFAQLSEGVREAKSHVCDELLSKLKTCPRNYGALTFILSKAFKEDFEDLPEDVKQMVDIYIKVIKPLMDKGAINYGKEETKALDSESDQTPRSLT